MPVEHLPALRAGRMVRERGEAAPDGECTLVRFADDLVMTFDHTRRQAGAGSVGEAPWTVGLTLHPDKTRFIDFRPQRLQGARHPETEGPPFDFLGFTHVWGVSEGQGGGAASDGQEPLCPRAGRGQGLVPATPASADPRPARPLSAKLVATSPTTASPGTSALAIVRQPSGAVWRKWLARRDRQGGSFGTASTHSSPATHCLQPGSSTDTPRRAKLSREEPDAGKLHVRVCEG